MRLHYLALGALLACGGPTEPGDLPVEATPATRDIGRITGAVEVHFEVTNRSRQAVFVANCGGEVSVIVERQVGFDWEGYSGGICQAFLLSVPMELAPGASLSGVISIADFGRFRLRPVFALELSQPATPGRPSPSILVHWPPD